MRSRCVRKSFAILSCLLLVTVTAGCLEGAGGPAAETEGGERTDVATETRTETNTDPRHDIGDREAKERALAAEEKYLTNVFENASCVEGWGLTPYGGIYENATVEERTEDGVYVEVTHPYWYGTETEEVDSGTWARYLVTEENAERVEGDYPAPC